MKAMRKKSFAAFLALALLVLVLSSCTFDGSGTQQSPSSQDSQESLDQESSSSESEAQEPAEEDIKGEWKGDVYTNRYLNLSFALPEGWTAASDEEMLEMMDLGSELMDNEAGLVSELLKVKVIYNMMAADNTTGNNIIVSMENLALTVGGTSIDEEAYAEAVAAQLQAVDNLHYTIGERSQVEIAGETFLKAPVTMEADGVTLQQAYYLRRVGKYMAILMVTDADNTGVDTLASYFSAAQ